MGSLAATVGAPESGLRLILGQMSAYPIFMLHRMYLKKSPSSTQHLYFLVTGMFMAWWAVGNEALMHSTICVFVTYLTLRLGGANFNTTGFLFGFNLLYLFLGYVFNASREYDITWTMPQCVLCLRLIGLAFDCYDGTKPESELGRDQKLNQLKEIPSLIECLSHSFFVGAYFVGPQFSMRKFQNYVEMNQTEDHPTPVAFGLKRLGIGWLYMIGHLIGSAYVPESWVLTEDYANMNFVVRSFWFSLWSKVILAKYIAAWLFAEGASTLSGLSYVKDEKTGEVMWNGMANVKLRIYESSHKFQHLIDSFNINTNGWAANYVYKRLRFLNNKMYSQVGTLLFLAIWHGYHSGYFITFANELLTMTVEKEFHAMLAKSSKAQEILQHPIGSIVSQVLGYVFIMFWLPHCFMAFPLLKLDKYLPVMWNNCFILQIFFSSWFLVKGPLKAFLQDKRPEEKKNE